MELVKQKVFVKVEDRLPSETGRYYTDGHRGIDFYKKGNCRFDDDANWWLDSKDGYFFSKDSLIKLLADCWESGKNEEYKNQNENFETETFEEYISNLFKQDK